MTILSKAVDKFKKWAVKILAVVVILGGLAYGTVKLSEVPDTLNDPAKTKAEAAELIDAASQP